MKDMPIFMGQWGVGSLVLREIPTKRCAYVMVRSALPGGLRAFLEECRQFCVDAGAEWVLATADEPIDFLPHVHDMLEMTCRRELLPPPWRPIELEPVTAANGDDFLRLYNRLFRAIPNAQTYTQEDLRRILDREQAYFALVGGQRAGFGELCGDELLSIGVLPEHRGLGHPLALTLLSKMDAPVVRLRVSSVNQPALRLYRKLGFDRSRVLSRWYALAQPATG